jgi:hypothetical protein
MRLVYGVGINDSMTPTAITAVVGGVRKNIWICPYYKKWVDMLARCYSLKVRVKRPSYLKCTVCPDWLYLSNFKRWVDEQPNRNWQNCHLDKDLLKLDNTYYSAESVVFITPLVNTFVLFKKDRKYTEMLGVHWCKKIKKYIAQCHDPLDVKPRHIGSFEIELEAHRAWQTKKHEYACALAELQDDPRVAQALRERYAPDKDWTNI